MPQLTFTRYVAALAVVAFHVVSFHLGHGVQWQADARLLTFVTQWPVAVTFFFVLSGFVLATAYPRLPDAAARRRFWRARFARIYPVYLLALVATIAVQEHAEPAAAPASAAAFAGQALLVQAFVPAWVGTLNYPGWSLSAEAFFYALFPWLIAWLGTRASTRAMVAATLALWVVTQVTYMALLGLRASGQLTFAQEVFVRFNPLLYVSSFVWGIAAARLLRRASAWLTARPWIACWGAAVMALAAVMLIFAGLALLPALPQSAAFPLVTDHCAFAPLFALAIVALAADRSVVARMLAWRPLVVLGEASYAVYILQVPAWALFVWLAYPHLAMGPLGAFGVFVTLLTVSSVAVLYAVEKPARAWLRAPAARSTRSATNQA